MRRKGNPPTLLVGIQAVAATLENSTEVPQKVENRATLRPNNRSTEYLPKRYRCGEKKGHLHPNVNSSKSPIAKLWKEPRCPLADEWIKKMWNIHTMEYYSAIKKNELLPFAMT